MCLVDYSFLVMKHAYDVSMSGPASCQVTVVLAADHNHHIGMVGTKSDYYCIEMHR